ncbi:MAG: SIS domain-containing protein [Alphaproteobacteria bacterium]|nr:SIS domain-containing protein [Alphaproteobacteria bacterium]
MTIMQREISEIPDIIAKIIHQLELYHAIGRKMMDFQGAWASNARGTSDHSAHYFKFLVEYHIGKLVTPLSPSLSSIYGANLQLEHGMLLSISQSGGSPDLIASQANAKKNGAHCFCLTNQQQSVLATQSDAVIAMSAGDEQAVAATKTFVASLFIGYCITQAMRDSNTPLPFARLQDALIKSRLCDEEQALGILQASQSVLVISRGAGVAIAREMALKLKETCMIHAEAYSAAEAVHGPMILACKNITVLAVQTNDAGNASILQAAELMRKNGAHIIMIETIDALGYLAPLVQITHFYRLVEKLSRHLGLNPDTPPMLNKATETV